MLLNQDPRGFNPALAVRGSRVAVAWRGSNSNYLYTSVGTMEADGPRFTRQVLMTWLLENTPEGFAPSLTFDQNGNLFTVHIAYTVTGAQLSYVYGTVGGDGAVDGKQFSLTTSGGYTPAAAFDDAGKLTIIYRGPSNEKILYFYGSIDPKTGFSGSDNVLNMSFDRW
jgi:hypothetical protein